MKSGFTVVELLVSLILLVVATVVIFAITTDATKLSMKIENTLNETYLVENALNLKLINLQFDNVIINSSSTLINLNNGSTLRTVNVTIYEVEKIGDEESNVPLFVFLP